MNYKPTTYFHRPALEDPENSYSVFMRDTSGRTLVNDDGEPYCIAACLTYEEAERMVIEHNKLALGE